jgi:ferredoxin
MDGPLAAIGGSCKGCGGCAKISPAEAIRLSLDGNLFMQESIQRLSPLLDVS